MMLRNFDIFEKFPDGSITWRASAFGQFEAERKLQELAEHSENEFLAVDILDGEPWPMAELKKTEATKKAATRYFQAPSSDDYETSSRIVRKSQITQILQGTPLRDEAWMDVESIASVEVSSEDSDYPIDSALLLEGKRGWRAVHPGIQKIRLIFDEPQELRRITLAFGDTENTRTQEFVPRWSPHIESSFRDIVRQQWNFSSPDSVRETEDYAVELSGVKVLELIIIPDRNGREAEAAEFLSKKLGLRVVRCGQIVDNSSDAFNRLGYFFRQQPFGPGTSITGEGRGTVIDNYLHILQGYGPCRIQLKLNPPGKFLISSFWSGRGARDTDIVHYSQCSASLPCNLLGVVLLSRGL